MEKTTFRGGFMAVVALWPGMIPFALAYAVSARSAGLTLFDTQFMSLAVFAGASQFSAAGMFASGAGGMAIIATTFLINLRHMLYGLNLGRRMQLTPPQRVLAAHLLTDEAFGVSATGRIAPAYVIGAGMSVFVIWNAFTFIGYFLGAGVADPVALGLDFVFPLAFVALLVPLLVGRNEIIVAVVSGAVALLLSRFAVGGVTILVTAVTGSLLGAWLTTRRPA